MAEAVGTAGFHRLIDRFYRAATEVFVGHGALIENLIGDEVAGIFAPGIAGPDHPIQALSAARELLVATGHAAADGPWIPLGAGVHTGQVYAGAVGTSEQVGVVTVLGDTANTTARLASAAARGEILVSNRTAELAGLDVRGLESRSLELRGRRAPIDVVVVRVGS